MNVYIGLPGSKLRGTFNLDTDRDQCLSANLNIILLAHKLNQTEL